MEFKNGAGWHAGLIVTVLLIGLWVDQRIELWGQIAVSVAVWAIYLAYLQRADKAGRLSLLACLCYATAGELFCSLVWGLYEYRLHNVPMFVPPGHCLLFMLGVICAPRAPRWIVWAVPLAATAYAGWVAWYGIDTQGLMYLSLFLVCMAVGSNKRLYASMFLLSLVLEFYGTWVGNWRWAHSAPWTGLISQNPPVCAGAFYCALDALVVATVHRLHGKESEANSATLENLKVEPVLPSGA
jgi:hypothetical protein